MKSKLKKKIFPKLRSGCIIFIIITSILFLIGISIIISLAFFPAIAVKISNDPNFKIPNIKKNENRKILTEFNKRYSKFMSKLDSKKRATFSATDKELNIYSANNIKWKGLEQPYSAILFKINNDNSVCIKAQLAFKNKEILITWGFCANITVKNKKPKIEILSGKIGRLNLSKNQASALFNWIKRKSDLKIENELDLGYGIKNIYIKDKKVYIESILNEK